MRALPLGALGRTIEIMLIILTIVAFLLVVAGLLGLVAVLVVVRGQTQRMAVEDGAINSLNLGYIVTDITHRVLVMNTSARQFLKTSKAIGTLEEVAAKLPKRLELLDHARYCSIEHKSCSFREVELGGRKVRLRLAPVFDGAELRGNVLTIEDVSEVNQSLDMSRLEEGRIEYDLKKFDAVGVVREATGGLDVPAVQVD